MKKVELVSELLSLLENRITKKDTFRINLNDTVLDFIKNYDVNDTIFKSEEMLNQLVDYIQITNDCSRIHI